MGFLSCWTPNAPIYAPPSLNSTPKRMASQGMTQATDVPNRHVRDKIRQQLQVLRDAGLLIHVSPAVWRLP